MSEDRLPWFKCVPSKLLGALAAMSAEEQLVYLTTLLRIYEVNGPIGDDAAMLARRTGLTQRKVSAAIARLCDTGKLMVEAGRLMNPVAKQEIEDAKTISVERSKAGKNKSQKVEQNQQTRHRFDGDLKGVCSSIDDQMPTHLHLHLDKKERESRVEGAPTLFADPKGEETAQKPAKANKPAALSYPKDFDEKFWQPYPRTQIMSKKETFTAWGRLSPADQGLACAAIPAFKQFLAGKPDYPVVHACRFLSQRRFEGFAVQVDQIAKATEVMAKKFYAKIYSPELEAWKAHYRKTQGHSPPSDARGGWYFDTPWPPGHLENTAN